MCRSRLLRGRFCGFGAILALHLGFLFQLSGVTALGNIVGSLGSFFALAQSLCAHIVVLVLVDFPVHRRPGGSSGIHSTFLLLCHAGCFIRGDLGFAKTQVLRPFRSLICIGFQLFLSGHRLVFLGRFSGCRFFFGFLGFFLGFQPVQFSLCRCFFLRSVGIGSFFLHQSQQVGFIHQIHKVYGLCAFTVPVDYQIKCRTRFRYQRDELLPGTIRIIGVVIVHQCQIALRGQCAGGFIRDGNNIFLHDFRQNRLFHRRGIIPISECRSCHADAQHRRQQQRTQFLNLHLHRPPSRKLHPRQTAQPGSGWRLPTAAAGRQAVPA